MYSRLVLLIVPLLSTRHTLARSYNVTIDDQMGDPTTGLSIDYIPADVWKNGQDCERCAARPRPADNAYMGTWKDATFRPSDDLDESSEIAQASVSFIGTAVYVNCILTGSRSSPYGGTDLTFKINNVTVGTFEQEPDGNSAYRFGVTVFSRTGLENTVHTLSIESGRAGRGALILLDSIVYTKEVEDPTSSRNDLPSITYTLPNSETTTSTSSASLSTTFPATNNTPAIVGGVVGGLVAITAILAISFLCYRRQKRPRSSVRVILDTSDVASPVSPFTKYSSHPSSPNRIYQEERNMPFAIPSQSVPTLAPGDSVSQANDSDHTSDWTSINGDHNPRRNFRERAQAFALSRGRTSVTPMKIQNATDADLRELESHSEIKLPPYVPSKLDVYTEKGKS